MYHLRNASDITASQRLHSQQQPSNSIRNGTHRADDASHDMHAAVGAPTPGNAPMHQQPHATQYHGNTRLVSTAANLEYARRVELERYERLASGNIDDSVLDALVDRHRIADEVLRDLASMPNAASDWQEIRKHRAESQRHMDAARNNQTSKQRGIVRDLDNCSNRQCKSRHPQNARKQHKPSGAQHINAMHSENSDAFSTFDRYDVAQHNSETERYGEQRRKTVDTKRAAKLTQRKQGTSQNTDNARKHPQQSHTVNHKHDTDAIGDKNRLNSMPSLNVETSIKARRRRIGIRTTQIAASVGVACVLGLGLFNVYASQQARAASGVDIAGVIASMPTDDDGHVETMGSGTLMQASYRTDDADPLVSDAVGEDGSVAASISDIAKLRSSAVGMADAAVEELGDYVDADALRDAESRMTGATSVDAFDAARADFDKLISDAKDEKATDEAEKKRAEETKMTGDRSKGPQLTKSAGVVFYNGHKETFYNLDMSVLISQFTNEFGEYHIDDRGFKMLGDYIMVAANLDLYPKGTIVETSAGQGVVVDTGGFAKNNPTQFDIATNW